MLYTLTQLLSDQITWFRVFHYLTFRSICGALTALVLAVVLGPMVIRWLAKMQVGQVVRDNGPQSHLSKAGTPTMGGVLILLAIGLSTLLWCDLSNPYIWLIIFVTLGFGGVGWVDDYKKLVLKNPDGLMPGHKFFWQAVVTIFCVGYLYTTASLPVHTDLIIPFTKQFSLPLGILFPVFSFFVIVGSSNAVNLTDGLDGLAIMPVVLVGAAFGVFAYASGHAIHASYLAVPHIPEVGELSVFCAAMAGAGLGFLWYNTYPAQIFMGDVGSLGLGAALGTLAVLVRQELILCIMGGVFVAETLSVILQVAYFKYTKGQRLFLMAPLHHHFELKGWPEPKIVVRFWIITFILVLVGLASLKLR